MVEKLSHQRISIRTSLRKQQSPGGKTIDSVHDEGSLSLRLEFCNKQRQSGRSVRALNRHSQKSGRFVPRHRLRKARKAPGRNEAGAGLREPKPDPAFLCGCEPCEEVSSLARCLTIRPLSNHSADIANTKIASEWRVTRPRRGPRCVTCSEFLPLPSRSSGKTGGDRTPHCCGEVEAVDRERTMDNK